MKRIFALICSICMLAGIFSMPVAAAEYTPTEDGILVSESVEVLEDGSSVEILVYETPVNSRATTYTKTGTKYYNLRNADGDILWTFKVTGTFSVTTGSSAVCTAASHTYTITNDSWNYVSGSSYKSGNKAIGHGEFNRKMLLITVEAKTCDVTLTCDVNGNLS